MAKVKLEKKTDGTEKYSTFAGFPPSPLEDIHHHNEDVRLKRKMEQEEKKYQDKALRLTNHLHKEPGTGIVIYEMPRSRVTKEAEIAL